RHILVSTEEEANTVLEKLNAGEDWATLAATYSIDTSNKDNGGDLGWFGRGVMIQEFEDAAFALTDIGQVSDPVKTSEGWHIIQLVGKSTNPLTADAFSQLKETTFTNWLKDLRDSRTDVNIDPIWSEYTPSIPAVPSDLQSAIFSS
ncbi:MAG: peptidylprolyl isomerase, partial [Anaerolineaceae bacterium]|nr:peptidylprolyl isomerase [Anaerolineaceae bacterium]